MGMGWVRRIFLYLLTVILFVCLIGAALTTSLKIGVTHPSKIESWLSQSNVYPNIEAAIVNQAQTSVANNSPGGISISQTTIQQSVASAFPQASLQQDVQTFINSNYAWLKGSTSTPTFKIDLTHAKAAFANKVATISVTAHLASLPPCSAAQTLQLQSANPLLLSCRPAGVSPQIEITQVSQQIASSSDFLSNPVITASTLPSSVTNTGKPYYVQFSKLPKLYKAVQVLPYAFGVLTILCLLIIVFSARSKRSAIKRIAVTLFVSGLLLIGIKISLDTAFTKLQHKIFNNANNAQLQQSLSNAVHYLEKGISKVNLWFGIAYLLVALLLIGLLIIRRRRLSKSIVTSDHPSAVDRSRAPSPTTINPSLPEHSQKSNFDIVGPPRKMPTPPRTSSPRINRQNLKERPNRRPPRLIQ